MKPLDITMPHPKINTLCIVLMLLCSPFLPAAETESDSELSSGEALFLERHWPEQISLQGKPPKEWSDSEKSLSPKECGVCHPQQYKDWSTTLHSKAMGPGIYGQLIDMVDSDPATTRICWGCHTPLAEQQDVLYRQDSAGSGSWVPNPAFDPDLQKQGLVCAACHIRGQQRFGPPRAGDPGTTGKIDNSLPHDGFTANTAFSKSAFCRGCHQFGPDDYALNGKLIENTYNEWLESGYPKQGIQCQDCHMPERRHLWRGIHDPEMVKKGVTIEVTPASSPVTPGEFLKAVITLTNTGTGHYFPTYLTPKVFVRARLLDFGGHPLPETLQEAIIGREATLDLSQELYDTRIPPGVSLEIEYQQQLTQTGAQLEVQVTVEPDHFYEKFYRSVLSGNGNPKGRHLLQQALEDAQQSHFTIYRERFPL